MNYKLILAALALVFSTATFGQNAMDKKSDETVKAEAMELTERMTDYLELEDMQVERMKGLNMSIVKKKNEIMSMDIPTEEKVKMFEDFNQRHSRTVKQVLNKEQYEKYNKEFDQKLEMSKK